MIYNKKVSCFSSLSWLKIFSCLAFIVSLFFVVIYSQRYLAARQWHNAHELACSGKYQESEKIYSNIYPKLKWNGRFLSYYGNVVLNKVAEDNDPPAKYSEAIELFEKAKYTYPDPYLFENLGVAYVRLATHPVPIKNRGTPLERGLFYWKLSSNILPWRLTPKFYLADLYNTLGDTNNAIKYARLVVNTPMKKWTDRGKEFKLKSQKMLIELGQKCDDPGLLVFNIHDKKTWNEGGW